MKDSEDFVIAHNYMALSAWKTESEILAYCFMSNHAHFLITSHDRKTATVFLRLFKRLYSTFLLNKYESRNTLRKTNDCIVLIETVQYFRNCVAYIIRNPLCARICKKVEDYRWSSYPIYFNRRVNNDLKKVSELGEREKRQLLKTRQNLTACPFMIDKTGIISDFSFIRYDIVEKAFYNSGQSFLLSLGTCNDTKMEYEMAIRPLMEVNDTDLACIAENMALSRFNGKSLSELSTAEKCSMIKNLYFNNKSTIPQLSRILGIPRTVISQILGK